MEGQAIEIQESDGMGNAQVTCDLVVANASRLKDELFALTQRFQRVTLNLARAGEIDVSGVQLLIAINIAMSKGEKSIQIVEPSRIVGETLKMLGLDDMLARRSADQ